MSTVSSRSAATPVAFQPRYLSPPLFPPPPAPPLPRKKELTLLPGKHAFPDKSVERNEREKLFSASYRCLWSESFETWEDGVQYLQEVFSSSQEHLPAAPPFSGPCPEHSPSWRTRSSNRIRSRIRPLNPDGLLPSFSWPVWVTLSPNSNFRRKMVLSE